MLTRPRKIVQEGLERYPSNPDMAADYVHALSLTEGAHRAIEFGEKWDKENRDIRRNWRFGVFLAKAYEQRGVGTDGLKKMHALFQQEVQSSPREPKLWTEYGETLISIDRERGFKILHEGLKHCPTAQTLRVAYGRALLEDGRAEEAITQFVAALTVDFQPMFQHDVQQAAIYALLAQAYDAAGDSEKAESCYRFAIQHTEDFHLRQYCENRLIAISILRGDTPPTSESQKMDPELLRSLFGKLEKGSDDETVE